MAQPRFVCPAPRCTTALSISVLRPGYAMTVILAGPPNIMHLHHIPPADVILAGDDNQIKIMRIVTAEGPIGDLYCRH
jgi:hypothetical protein